MRPEWLICCAHWWSKIRNLGSSLQQNFDIWTEMKLVPDIKTCVKDQNFDLLENDPFFSHARDTLSENILHTLTVNHTLYCSTARYKPKGLNFSGVKPLTLYLSLWGFPLLFYIKNIPICAVDLAVWQIDPVNCIRHINTIVMLNLLSGKFHQSS